MVNRKIKCIVSVAKTEYLKWITNPRMIIVGVFLIFTYSLVIEPLLARAEKIGCAMSVFEPFIAVGNSKILIMFIPCVFMILISDYPKMTGNTLFYIQRTGKTNWFIGQIIFLVMAILTFLMTLLMFTVCISKGELSLHWSDAVTKYISKFPYESGNFASQLLPSNLYNQIPIYEVLLQTMALVAIYLLIISLIIYLFKLLHFHMLGLLAAVFVVAAGVLTCSINGYAKWAFPMANTIVWLHYEKILGKPIVPTWYSWIYLILITVTLVALNYLAVRKYQYVNIEHIE